MGNPWFPPDSGKPGNVIGLKINSRGAFLKFDYEWKTFKNHFIFLKPWFCLFYSLDATVKSLET